MVTYREIAETETDPEAALTSDLFKALQKNLLASLEGDPTAPVNQWDWHPYNKVLVGDSNNGRIWSFSVDGAVALITSPDFSDSYDYGFVFDKVSTTNATTAGFRSNLFRETSGAYAGAANIGVSISNVQYFTGEYNLLGIRTAKNQHFASIIAVSGALSDGTVIAGSGDSFLNSSGVRNATAQKILRAQFSFAAGNITGVAGSAIYMMKKRTARP